MNVVKKLIIFVKAPRPGVVKTRLAEALGADAACEVYRRLATETLRPLRSLAHVDLRFSPDDAGLEILPWLQNDWQALPQGEGDLGQRLQRAFAHSFAHGARRVVVIGSDCPEVGPEDVRQAWESLELHDVVIGPARDGGYWLLGLNRPRPALLEKIPWSGPAVLQTTLERAQLLELRVRQLRELSDIDTKEDWDHYCAGQELKRVQSG